MSLSTGGPKTGAGETTISASSSDICSSSCSGNWWSSAAEVSSPGGLFGVSYWRRVRVSSTRTVCFGPSTENEKSNFGSALGLQPERVDDVAVVLRGGRRSSPPGRARRSPRAASRGRGRPPRTAARFPRPGRSTCAASAFRTSARPNRLPVVAARIARVHEPVVGDVVVVADHVGGDVGEQATNLRHLAAELVEDGLGAEELEPGLLERLFGRLGRAVERGDDVCGAPRPVVRARRVHQPARARRPRRASSFRLAASAQDRSVSATASTGHSFGFQAAQYMARNSPNPIRWLEAQSDVKPAFR